MRQATRQRPPPAGSSDIKPNRRQDRERCMNRTGELSMKRIALADDSDLGLDETARVGGSVRYTMLPQEIVRKVVVEKSSSASLVEGGVAGSVDIITRKPLDFSKPFTLEASAGAVYADLPSKTDPQVSALGAFKNDAGNFGVMVQLFSEKRHLRRDGIEVLGYDTIAGKDAAGNPTAI